MKASDTSSVANLLKCSFQIPINGHTNTNTNTNTNISISNNADGEKRKKILASGLIPSPRGHTFGKSPRNLLAMSRSCNQSTSSFILNKENIRYSSKDRSPSRKKKSQNKRKRSQGLLTPKRNNSNANSREVSPEREYLATTMEFFTSRPLRGSLQQIDEVNSVVAQSTDNFTPGKLSPSFNFMTWNFKPQIPTDKKNKQEGNDANMNKSNKKNQILPSNRPYNLDLIFKTVDTKEIENINLDNGIDPNPIVKMENFEQFLNIPISEPMLIDSPIKNDEIQVPLILMQPIQESQGRDDIDTDEYVTTEESFTNDSHESEQEFEEDKKLNMEFEAVNNNCFNLNEFIIDTNLLDEDKEDLLLLDEVNKSFSKARIRSELILGNKLTKVPSPKNQNGLCVDQDKNCIENIKSDDNESFNLVNSIIKSEIVDDPKQNNNFSLMNFDNPIENNEPQDKIKQFDNVECQPIIAPDDNIDNMNQMLHNDRFIPIERHFDNINLFGYQEKNEVLETNQEKFELDKNKNDISNYSIPIEDNLDPSGNSVPDHSKNIEHPIEEQLILNCDQIEAQTKHEINIKEEETPTFNIVSTNISRRPSFTDIATMSENPDKIIFLDTMITSNFKLNNDINSISDNKTKEPEIANDSLNNNDQDSANTNESYHQKKNTNNFQHADQFKCNDESDKSQPKIIINNAEDIQITCNLYEQNYNRKSHKSEQFDIIPKDSQSKFNSSKNNLNAMYESLHKPNKSEHFLEQSSRQKYRKDSISSCKSFMLRLPNLAYNLDSSRISNLNDSIFSTKEYLEDIKDPSEEIIKRLKQKHDYYVDDIFLPNVTGLINNTRKAKTTEWIQNIQWKRISQIYKNSQGYNITLCDYIDPSIIKAVKLHNYYFASCLAALAEYPFYISRLFGNQYYNDQGCYSVRTCRDGNWRLYLIDDFIPIIKNTATPAFMDINLINDVLSIWPILLEKAWAKAYDNYENIKNGNILDTLKELTGAPSFNVSILDPELWEKLIDACNSKYIMIACPYEQKINGNIITGLNKDYGYTILGIFVVGTHQGTERLISLRNNWPDSIWKGEWNQSSPRWTRNIIEEIQSYDIDINQRDVIWMTFKEFQETFSNIIINKANEGHINSQIRLRQHKNAHSMVEFSIPKPTAGFLEVTQLDRKLFRNPSQYEYSNTRLILFRKDNKNEYTYISGIATHKQKSTILEVDLQPGEYIAVIMIDWNNDIYDFNVGFYGDIQIEWNRLRLKENQDLFTNLWKKIVLAKGNRLNINKKPEYNMYLLEMDDIKLKIEMITNESMSMILGLRRIISKAKQNCNYELYIPKNQSYSTKKANESEIVELGLKPETSQVILLLKKDFNLDFKIDYKDT